MTKRFIGDLTPQERETIKAMYNAGMSKYAISIKYDIPPTQIEPFIIKGTLKKISERVTPKAYIPKDISTSEKNWLKLFFINCRRAKCLKVQSFILARKFYNNIKQSTMDKIWLSTIDFQKPKGRVLGLVRGVPFYSDEQVTQ